MFTDLCSSVCSSLQHCRRLGAASASSLRRHEVRNLEHMEDILDYWPSQIIRRETEYMWDRIQLYQPPMQTITTTGMRMSNRPKNVFVLTMSAKTTGTAALPFRDRQKVEEFGLALTCVDKEKQSFRVIQNKTICAIHIHTCIHTRV